MRMFLFCRVAFLNIFILENQFQKAFSFFFVFIKASLGKYEINSENETNTCFHK